MSILRRELSADHNEELNSPYKDEYFLPPITPPGRERVWNLPSHIIEALINNDETFGNNDDLPSHEDETFSNEETPQLEANNDGETPNQDDETSNNNSEAPDQPTSVEPPSIHELLRPAGSSDQSQAGTTRHLEWDLSSDPSKLFSQQGFELMAPAFTGMREQTSLVDLYCHDAKAHFSCVVPRMILHERENGWSAETVLDVLERIHTTVLRHHLCPAGKAQAEPAGLTRKCNDLHFGGLVAQPLEPGLGDSYVHRYQILVGSQSSPSVPTAGETVVDLDSIDLDASQFDANDIYKYSPGHQ